MASIEIRTCDRLAEIPAVQWDALHGGANPFLHHAFLSGLEDCDCLGEQGWYPLHLVAWQDDSVVGALPLYLRDNSYGEFVFDWNWAEAYERSGRDYYPKLVTAVPFTPATGPREIGLVADRWREDPSRSAVWLAMKSTAATRAMAAEQSERMAAALIPALQALGTEQHEDLQLIADVIIELSQSIMLLAYRGDKLNEAVVAELERVIRDDPNAIQAARQNPFFSKFADQREWKKTLMLEE